MPEYDYLREIDLNAPPMPINSSLDLRAMHYFGFVSHGQEIVMLPPTTGGNVRVLVSWRYINNPGPFSPASPIQADAILDFISGPLGQAVRYESHHDRAHAVVWLDPTPPVPTGPVIVRIRAWRKE